jgi:hypothetical protein
MAKKKKMPEKYQRWIDARKRYNLSHAHIQMARELGHLEKDRYRHNPPPKETDQINQFLTCISPTAILFF